MRQLVLIAFGALVACTGHVHEDVEEPEIEEEDLAEEEPADPDRWQAVTEEWSDAQPPAETAKQSYQIGIEAYQRGDYEAALRAFQAAYELEPLDPLRYNMARCLQQMGRIDEAIVHLDALAQSAADPNIRSEAAQQRDALLGGE